MANSLVIPQLTQNEIERFWKKVNKSAANGCWEWTRYCTPYGYGQVGFRYTLYLAHRVSWMLATGDDPGTFHVLHKCDNPPCVNPDHLFLGTPLDNAQDMIGKNRQVHTKNARGEKNGTAKLTEEQVKEIWSLHLHQGLGERKLAKRFQVTPANIHCILSGQTWKHLIPDDLTPIVRPKAGHPRHYPTDGTFTVNS